MDEIEVTANKSWYHHNQVASPLFPDHNLSHPHVPIGEGIRTEVVIVIEARHKHGPSPSLDNLPTVAKQTTNKKLHAEKASS